MTFYIAFLADSHLGYRAKVRSNAKGINIRVQDGYDAFRETLEQIITSPVPIGAVVHGGDLFHSSKPSIRDIATAQHYLRELAKRSIPFYGLTGNHDATDAKAELSAVAAVNDPDKQIFALYEPYKQYELTDGIVLHSMSHHGLSAEDAPTITPVDGALNLFTTHGAALDPKNKTLMMCADSPREQMIPVEMILDEGFILKLLGHYHSRHAVGGESLNTWYSGSSVRRGFSDDAGERGWLLIGVEPDGRITVTPKNIKQRPQFDLPSIDADGMTSSDVMNLLEINMGRTATGGLEPIVRQKVINAPRSIREGLDRDRIRDLSEHMLSWQLEFARPEELKKASTKEASLSDRNSVNIMEQYKDWAKQEIESVPEEYRDEVSKSVTDYLKKAKAEDLQHTH